ncbi:MAG: hypothetical protein IJU64_06635 [Bacilli bacterium]|nr:hypothetical protein [Bacilli bacterium]
MKKKSLLVVPALGVLLLAAAGSVGGTVAWFSSVTSATVEGSVFEVKPMGGDLSVTMSNAIGGTTTDNGDSHTFVMATGDVLTHASYDHEAGTIYTASSENNSGVRRVVASGDAASAWKAKDDFETGKDMWWAVSWQMTFTYKFNTEGAALLFFDPNSAVAAQEESAVEDTIKGFRVAFVGATPTANSVANKRVWAPKRATNDATPANQPHYVDDATAYTIATNYTGGKTYTGKTIMASNTMEAKHGEGTALTTDYSTGDSAEYTCLGKFGKATEDATQTALTFTVVVWFEGTDPSIVSTAEHFNKVAATMKFYTREYKAS